LLYGDEFFICKNYGKRKIQKKSEAALREESVLQFWKEIKFFEKSLKKDSKAGEFVFYEGPPTANGKPGNTSPGSKII